MFIEILDRLKGERGPLLPKKKPEKELQKIRDANFEKAKPALENPDEVREMFFQGGPVSESVKKEIKERFPEADFDKHKFGVPKGHPMYNKLRGINRREQRSEYNRREEVKEKRKVNQKNYYEENPEKFLERNKKYVSKPEVQLKRRADQKRRYYYEGDREKALLRLKGVVASKGYGGYFKNPDNALLRDMVRMAEQNPGSGLEIIRKGPRNLIVGVKEGDTIYHALAAKRKPVAYAPKKSIPITEHPDFKTRFEFTKQQKKFSNTKIPGTNITYGKALDALQSEKAGTPLQNKNPAEFEHVKGVATDYKEGQIALRTANRDKQLILSSLKNNNISKQEADKQLKKIGVRAFVDKEYIGAPKIDAEKQFEDLKKFVNRSFASGKLKGLGAVGLTPQGKEFKKVADAANKSALTELAARTGSGVDPMLLLKAGKEELVDPVLRGAGKVLTSRPATALSSPTAMAGVSASLLAENPSDPFGYAALAGMGASSKFVADKIKNPLIQRALNLGFKPAQIARAASITTPVGIAATGVASLVNSARKFQEEFDALSPEEKQSYLKEQEQFAEDFNRDEFLMADGGPVDKGRRKFIKGMGILAALPFVGKYIKPATKAVETAAPAVAEGVKLGYDKFLMLVEKIKKLGTPNKRRTQNDLEEATVYRGQDGSEYELVEDLASGDVRVTRDKYGMKFGGDEAYDTIEDRSTFYLKKGQADETTKGKKPPDEYDEVQEVPSRDGTFDDVDDIKDNIVKEIEEEITGKKGFYKGGLTDTISPERGPMYQGIAGAYQTL